MTEAQAYEAGLRGKPSHHIAAARWSQDRKIRLAYSRGLEDGWVYDTKDPSMTAETLIKNEWPDIEEGHAVLFADGKHEYEGTLYFAESKEMEDTNFVYIDAPEVGRDIPVKPENVLEVIGDHNYFEDKGLAEARAEELMRRDSLELYKSRPF